MNNRIDEGKMAGGKLMLIHVIEADDVIREFPGSSLLNNSDTRPWCVCLMSTPAQEPRAGHTLGVSPFSCSVKWHELT